MQARDAILARHSDRHEWLTYSEAWRIDVFALRARAGGVGYRRVAYEIKVSRGDFLSEIKKPAKRRRALDLSHEFYFAVPRGMVSSKEIEAVAPECGLVWVWLPDPESGRTRAITRVQRPAPLREPRDFTIEEVVYLARMPMYRAGIAELERRASVAEYALRLSRSRSVLASTADVDN